jgi:hypothetical protein
MFLRKDRVKGKTYWTLVETYRTERGPRQRVISYLGDINEPVRKGVEALAEERPRIVQNALFDEDIAPDWQTVDTGRIKQNAPERLVTGGSDYGSWTNSVYRNCWTLFRRPDMRMSRGERWR